MTKRTTYGRFCPLSRALDVLGERWTLIILNELMMLPRRYTDLRSALPGMGTNVLSDRLRKLEAFGIVTRRAGAAGDPVVYELTERGSELGPALTELRKFGADVLLLADGVNRPDSCPTYDMSYAIPPEGRDAQVAETYQWEIGGHVSWITVDDTTVTQGPGPAAEPILTMRTTRSVVHQLCQGVTTWDEALATGHIDVTGDETAWDRMHTATGDPRRRLNS